MYQFNGQAKQGKAAEQTIDTYLGQWFHVYPVGPQEQRHGIDRRLVGLKNGQKLSMEYKVDRTAGSSGNAFIEVGLPGNKAGWARTSEADFLAYYVPGRSTLYLVRMSVVRGKLGEWAGYGSARATSSGGQSVGLLVPLNVLGSVSEQVHKIGD
jgi:hypothetical protein